MAASVSNRRTLCLLAILLAYCASTHAFLKPVNFIDKSSSVYNRKLSLGSTLIDAPKTESFDYDWQKKWYAVCFENYLPEGQEPLAYSVFGKSFVIWRNNDGMLACVEDQCSHRAAKLSEGQVRDGNIECRYHGWQFSDKGDCVRIPQLKEGASPPRAACLQHYEVQIREGIVWLYPTPILKADLPLPPIPVSEVDLDVNETFTRYDFQIDLPYDNSFLVENLLDPAHIPISHDRTPGGGKREDAQAFDMRIDPSSISPDGFTGTFQKTRPNSKGKLPPAQKLSYQAPGIVRYHADSGKFVFGAALHCMPLGFGRSRLLFRTFYKAPLVVSLMLEAKPMWMRHLNSCKVLEQDVGLITTQEDIQAANQNMPLKDLFLPLATADEFVVAYRKWLDRVQGGLPWAVGWETVKPPPGRASTGTGSGSGSGSGSRGDQDGSLSLATRLELSPALNPHHRAYNPSDTRYQRHVRHCPASRRALKTIQRLKVALAGLGLAGLLGVSLGVGYPVPVLRGTGVATAALLAASFLLGQLEKRFFVSFDTKKFLRKQRWY